MRRFLYREPRINTHLSLDFIVGDTVVLGTCRNISESGIGGTLSHPLADCTKGSLTLYLGDESLKLEAVVESSVPEEARVRFCFSAPADREEVRRFLQLVSASRSS